MSDNQPANQFVPLLRGDRPLPHNTEAEIAVLGCILLDSQRALDVAVGVLNFPDSFYHPRHQAIFQTILALSNGQTDAVLDAVMINDALEKEGRLAEVGGAAYLAQVMNSVPTAANIEHYAGIVHDNAVLRRLITQSADTLEKCFEAQTPVKELVDDIERELMSITGLGAGGGDLVAVGDMLNATIDYMDRMFKHDVSVMGLQTGYTELDRIILGLRPAEMFVLAARPSIGKTALALNVAENLALSSTPVPVGLFSLEMSTQQLVLRLLCSLARISLGDVRDCALGRPQWNQVMNAGQRLKDAAIYIDDASAHLDVVELRARARQMKREYDVQVILIDYLQLIKPVGGNRNSTRENEVAQISAGIKGLARELNIPIVVLAQLNRQAEQAGQRPKLSHLRESGAIEQDADIVALLHRERDIEQFEARGGEGASSGSERRDPHEAIDAELIVAKNRNGRTGIAKLKFVPAYTRFENASLIPDDAVPKV